MRELSNILVKEWHYEKNGNITPDTITTLNIKVWWKCSLNLEHEWEAIIANRAKGTGCPYCSHKKVSEINWLYKHSELIKEWNYEKNNITPKQISEFSSKKVWWKCEKDHEWKAIVASRTSGARCPYCFGDMASAEYNLFIQFPTISNEWHEKNKEKPKDILPFSKKKVWWRCSKDHEWEACINDRTSSGSGCHICSGYAQQNKCQYNEDKSLKVCNSCDKMLPILEFRLRSSKGNWINSICKICESMKTDQYRTMTKSGLVAEIIRRKKSECKIHELPFDLTKDWVMNKLEEINWCCELTGLPMKTLKTNLNEKFSGFNWNSISLDRINPNGGYTKDNVRFVLNQVNIFRQNGSDDKMYEIAEALLKHKTRK